MAQGRDLSPLHRGCAWDRRTEHPRLSHGAAQQWARLPRSRDVAVLARRAAVLRAERLSALSPVRARGLVRARAPLGRSLRASSRTEDRAGVLARRQRVDLPGSRVDRPVSGRDRCGCGCARRVHLSATSARPLPPGGGCDCGNVVRGLPPGRVPAERRRLARVCELLPDQRPVRAEHRHRRSRVVTLYRGLVLSLPAAPGVRCSSLCPKAASVDGPCAAVGDCDRDGAAAAESPISGSATPERKVFLCRRTSTSSQSACCSRSGWNGGR